VFFDMMVSRESILSSFSGMLEDQCVIACYFLLSHTHPAVTCHFVLISLRREIHMSIDSVLPEEIAEKKGRSQAGVLKAHSPAEIHAQFNGIDNFFLLFSISSLRGIGQRDECVIRRKRKL